MVCVEVRCRVDAFIPVHANRDSPKVADPRHVPILIAGPRRDQPLKTAGATIARGPCAGGSDSRRLALEGRIWLTWMALASLPLAEA
jgi:hypothetical protein